MNAIALTLFAAAGFLIGLAAGSVAVSRRAARSRATETMRRHSAMVAVLSRTAQPNKGSK
jgi:hypothetical protein